MADKDKKKREPYLVSIIKAMFIGRRKGDALSLMEEELVQSPGRTIVKTFFSRKLTVIGLTAFLIIFSACIIIPFFLPVDLRAIDANIIDIRPTMGMMRVPRALQGNIAHLSAGNAYGMGLSRNGEVYSWGLVPNRVAMMPDFAEEGLGKIIHVSAGYDHALAIDENGNMAIWGPQVPVGIINIPRGLQGNFVTAEASRQFTVAIDKNGDVHAWGGPASSPNLNTMVANRHPSPAVAIAVNNMSGIVLFEDGRAHVITPRSNVFSVIPEEIQGRIVDVALSQHNGAALLDDGTLVIWGGNEPARNEMPLDIQGRVVSIVGGIGYFTALLDDGSVRSWGLREFLPLNQTYYPKNYNEGTAIFAGFHHTYAVNANGESVSWGLRGFLLGTDNFGRDMFSRLWMAGRYSLTAGAIAVIVSTIIGLFMGGLAGYYGGKVDMFIMRLGEVVQSIPFLPLVIILSQTVISRWGFDQIQRLITVMVISGVLGWSGLMRTTRGVILRERNSEYVTGARALGVREGKIIARHVMPNVLTIAIVPITLGLAGSMLTESTLSFIGFGVNEPIPTWGNMLTGSNNSIIMRTFWWRWVFPAIALVTATLSINLIGDGLREAIDPRSRGR